MSKDERKDRFDTVADSMYTYLTAVAGLYNIWEQALVVALFLAGIGTVLLFVEPDSYFYLFCYITAFLLFFARSNWMTPTAGKVYGRAKNIYYNRK